MSNDLTCSDCNEKFPFDSHEHICKTPIQKILDKLAEENRNIVSSKDIVCPYCKIVFDNETMYRFVTYWGEDGKKKIFCYDCNKPFYVEEIVSRIFETITMEWMEKAYPRYLEVEKK